MTSNRTTKQKQLILQVAKSHHDHPTADMIYLEVRAIDNHISRGTVYRNLEKFSETRDLLRIKVPGADRYDSRLDFHYHLLCTSCGNVFDAPIEYQNELDQMVAEKSGFMIDRHRTVFEGKCSNCLKASIDKTKLMA